MLQEYSSATEEQKSNEIIEILDECQCITASKQLAKCHLSNLKKWELCTNKLCLPLSPLETMLNIPITFC